MSEKRIKVTKDCIGIGFVVAAIYCLVRAFLLTFSTDIWYDELFSMEFAKRPFEELISLTSKDVHPPLYYMIVRVFLLLGNSFGLPIETSGKIASILPFLLLFVYAVTVIRKNHGMLASGLFCFASVTMPGLPEYTTEIRMYSWALFFVTASLIHAFNLMKNYLSEDRKWDLPNGIALFLFGTAAFYTHYYAALSVAIIYFYVLLWMIIKYFAVMGGKGSIKHLNFKAIAAVIISANLTAVCYVPWLSVLLGQAHTVSGSYWIQPVGLRTFGSCIKYLFSGYFSNSIITTVLAVILFILVAFIVVNNVIRLVKCGYQDENEKVKDLQNLMAVMVLPLLVIVGIVASILIRPVFVNRYMIPAMGTFYLAISISIGSVFNEKITHKITQIAYCILGILIAIVGCVDFKGFIGNEEYR